MPSALEPLGDAQRGVHVGAVGNDREIVAGAAQRRAADRQRRRRLGREPLLDARIAIERDVLVVEHGIRIRHGGRHQRARVGRRRRHDDLQPGRAVEPGLGVLAVVRTGVPQAAPRHAQHHRHGPAPAIADLRGVVHQLVEAGRDEIVELHLADRALAGERGADARADHRSFRERRVQDPRAEFLRAADAAAGTRCRSCRRRPRRRRTLAASARSASPTPIITASRNVLPFGSSGALARAAGAAASSRSPRGRPDRAPRSARARGSPASTPAPASSGAGHGASITARASRSTSASASLRIAFEVAAAGSRLRATSRAAYIAIGSRADQNAYSSRFGVALLGQRRIVPRRLRVLAEIQHVVVVRVAAHAHADQLDQRRTLAVRARARRPRRTPPRSRRDRCRRS